jgi:hypothetical protein
LPSTARRSSLQSEHATQPKKEQYSPSTHCACAVQSLWPPVPPGGMFGQTPNPEGQTSSKESWSKWHSAQESQPQSPQKFPGYDSGVEAWIAGLTCGCAVRGG